MSGVVASEGGRRTQSSIPVLHSGSHFRHGLLQLMIHTIDPLNDGKMITESVGRGWNPERFVCSNFLWLVSSALDNLAHAWNSYS